MAGRQREEVAACGRRFTWEMLLPMCWGAPVPLCLQLGPHLSMAHPEPGLSPCLDSQMQAGCALCRHSFPELSCPVALA